MTTYIADKNHTGPLVIPEGCTHAQVWDCASVTSITFPAGCTDAWVDNCPNYHPAPAVTHAKAPCGVK